MRGEGNHKIPGSFAPENMEKTGAERVKYSLACQHEDAIPIKFVPYAQKCPTVLCTFAVALRKESVDRNTTTVNERGLTWYKPQQALAESAITSTKRPISGGYGFGGDNSLPLEACALALWGAKTCKRDPTRKMRIG